MALLQTQFKNVNEEEEFRILGDEGQTPYIKMSDVRVHGLVSNAFNLNHVEEVHTFKEDLLVEVFR